MTKKRLAIEILLIVAVVVVGITLINLVSSIVIWLLKALFLAAVAYAVYVYHKKGGRKKAK
jgi:purine-cytosine permease-like protein